MNRATATRAEIFSNKMTANQENSGASSQTQAHQFSHQVRIHQSSHQIQIHHPSNPIPNPNLTAEIASKGVATSASCWTGSTLEMCSGKQSQMKWGQSWGKTDKIASDLEDPKHESCFLFCHLSIYNLFVKIKIWFYKIQILKFISSLYFLEIFLLDPKSKCTAPQGSPQWSERSLYRSQSPLTWCPVTCSAHLYYTTH